MSLPPRFLCRLYQYVVFGLDGHLISPRWFLVVSSLVKGNIGAPELL